MDESKKYVVSLLKRISQDDEKAFDEFYRFYRKPFENMAKNIVSPWILREFMDDLYNEVALYFWDKRHQIDTSKSEPSIFFWLIRTTKGILMMRSNKIIDQANGVHLVDEEKEEIRTPESEEPSELAGKIKEIGLDKFLLDTKVAQNQLEADVMVSILKGYRWPEIGHYHNISNRKYNIIRQKLESLPNKNRLKKRIAKALGVASDG